MKVASIGSISAAVVITAAAVAGGVAGPASAQRLPGGYKQVSDAGLKVQTWRTNEAMLPAPSMAANGMGRSAVLSGDVRTKVNKGTGKFRVGYVVGCQVSVGNLTAGLSGTLTPSLVPGTSSTGTVTGSFSLPLAPGEIKVVQLSTQDIPEKQGYARYRYSRVEIEIQGCGGWAQARSYAKVEAVEGYKIDASNADNIGGSGAFVQSTLFGKPFTL